MTRRKSRPLLPHEIISNFYSRQNLPNIAPSSSFSTESSSQTQDASGQNSDYSSQTTVNNHDTPIPHEEMAKTIAACPHPSLVTESVIQRGQVEGNEENRALGSKELSDGSIMPNISSQKPREHRTGLTRSLSHIVPPKNGRGYVANRRRASFMIHDEGSATARVSDLETHVQNDSDDGTLGLSRPLKRASSLVKLSLSLDGKAEVKTRTGGTPSPPRSQPLPLIKTSSRQSLGLQRSYSALEPSTGKVSQEASPPSQLQRPMAGRSRDARTWEFYCDSDTRNALTEQAQLEETGSATAAISLIRSCSDNRKLMTSNANKRNAHTPKMESSKRMKADDQKSKPKLARASSSLARLQTTNPSVQRQTLVKASHQKTKPKTASQTSTQQNGDSDSDKENWEPGTQTTNPRRRRPKTQAVSRILGESLGIPSQSTSLEALMQRENSKPRQPSSKGSSSRDKENSENEVDDEVAAFMGETVPREVDDLDCVQNLLSLSQAAWQ